MPAAGSILSAARLSPSERSAFAGVAYSWFLFGALLEGAAGFGAPVAITGALLVGLGFKPLYAAGAVSDCQHCAGGVWCVGCANSGRRSGNGNRSVRHWRNGGTSVTVPVGSCAVLAGSNDGRLERGERDVASGAGCRGSFAVTQFFTSNYIGPELPDITSALVSIVSLSLFLKVWRPKNTETAISMGQSAGAMVVNKPSSGGPVPSEYSLGQIIRAWSPFLILTVLVTIWTMKPFKAIICSGRRVLFTGGHFRSCFASTSVESGTHCRPTNANGCGV